MGHRHFIVLICRDCDASIRVKRGDLPEKCWSCLAVKTGPYSLGWRVATDGEWTKADLRLLASLRIKADDRH